ncbi:hypothetical protein HPB51_027768 [Rhipicephalus microplus]|uniref:Uncharacterized protein n=1 Tax=Rhipicephalus microplus TaxID=6941 RepID=A0A9J6CZ37_RHIMP|nr:hypothetical protein HPB51_027768 [Rhipicephalus microplus]
MFRRGSRDESDNKSISRGGRGLSVFIPVEERLPTEDTRAITGETTKGLSISRESKTLTLPVEHHKETEMASRKVPTLVRARPHRFLRRRALPSPGAVPFLLLYPSPTGSALRANPFPKVTDPFCRLPLPTLVYRLEAVHLGDLLQMWPCSGTKITLPYSDFQGPTGPHRTAQAPHCSTEQLSLSRDEPIPGTRSPYREKKTLPGAPIGVSELVCVAALGPEEPISVAGFGTVNPISF